MRSSFPKVVVLVILVALGVSARPTARYYRVVQKYGVPGEGGWDYIAIDAEARRLYVSHGNQLEVLNADTGAVVGHIAGTPGVHGAAIAVDLKRGFSSNGANKTVTMFDTETLQTVKKTSVAGTDFILYDPFSKRVFPMSTKVTVLDAVSGDKVGEIELEGSPEAAVSDGLGKVYANLENKGAIAVIDSTRLAVLKTYPIGNCLSPHSLSYDSAAERLFVGCRDGLTVLDATNGKVVARSMICSGVDGGGFDPVNKLIFESCGEGVISIIRQLSPDFYVLVDTVKTEVLAKTMVFDPKTKQIYLPTAELEIVKNTNPKFPYPFMQQAKAGTFHVLVVAPSTD